MTLSTDLSDIQTKGKAALDKMDTEVPNLIKAMERFRRKTNAYLGSGDASDMLAATEEYASMFELINNVFGEKTKKGETGAAAAQSGMYGGVEQDTDPTKGVKAKAATQISEKNSKKDLDNLIKEVILKRLLK